MPLALAAIRELLDRGYGKAVQAEGDIGAPIVIQVTKEEMAWCRTENEILNTPRARSTRRSASCRRKVTTALRLLGRGYGKATQPIEGELNGPASANSRTSWTAFGRRPGLPLWPLGNGRPRICCYPAVIPLFSAGLYI